MAKRPRLITTTVSEDEERSVLFKTSKGYTVTLMPLPPLLITRIGESVTMPKKPTYKIQLPGGEFEEHPHDKTTLQTDEDKAAWDKYIQDLQDAESEVTQRVMKAVISEGVEVHITPEELEKWRKKMERFGIKIPVDDEEETIAVFKETVIAADKHDMQTILQECMRLTGVTEEVINKTRGSFRNSVESEPSNGSGDSS